MLFTLPTPTVQSSPRHSKQRRRGMTTNETVLSEILHSSAVDLKTID